MVPVGVVAGMTGPDKSGSSSGLPKEGIYEFPEGGKKYVGQSKNIPNRLKQHTESGKLTEDAQSEVKTKAVEGGKTAREIAEHKRIQELTGGKPASSSPEVTNERDPIGPKRKFFLD